jgi:hypothetical protein
LIQPIKIDITSFKRKSIIKTEWLNGNVPLKKGFLGGELTPQNISIDHIKPRSQGGRSELSNYVLMTIENNGKKSSDDIFYYATKENTEQYFKAFEGIKLGKYQGEDYLKMISKTLRKLWQKSPVTKDIEMWDVLRRY